MLVSPGNRLYKNPVTKYLGSTARPRMLDLPFTTPRDRSHDESRSLFLPQLPSPCLQIPPVPNGGKWLKSRQPR